MTAPDFTLERNPFGRLVLTLADGTRHDGVTPVRAFPVAAPLEGLSLVATDGHEAAWVPRLDALPPATRSLIEQELATREFVPQVQRLVSVSSFSTPSFFTLGFHILAGIHLGAFDGLGTCILSP